MMNGQRMDKSKIAAKTDLKRSLRMGDTTLLVIGSVFGSGIFLTTGIVAERLPYSGLIWLAWAAGGIVTIIGALCYGELGGLFPKAGGPYVYLQKAYGRAAAFSFGWTFFWIIGGGGIAALAVGFADYAEALWPGMPRPAAAVFALAVMTALNSAGVVVGSRVQGALTVVRIASIAALVVGAVVVVAKTGNQHLSPFWPSATNSFSWTAFGTALIAVFWSYDGWYAVNCTAEEIRSPGKTIPLSLVLGTTAVLVLYLAANVVYSITVPMSRMVGLVRIGEASAASLFGASNGIVFAAVIALAILGCLGANILFCARVPFAMARDGLFFPILGRVHPRSAVPLNALAAQMIWASLLCLSGTYEELIEFVMFAAVLFYAATAAAVVVLRKKDPEASRPYRVWGYPILPAAYVIFNLALVIALIVEKPLPSLAGAGFILLGGPAFLLWRKKESRCPRA